jgi:hypothetical protein
MLLVAGAGLFLLTACDSEPAVDGALPSVQRLTEQQYRNTIADLFGPHIVVAGTFYPILRTDGLVAIGAREATVSALSFERFEKLAQSIAEQVVNERNRGLYFPCAPANPGASDDECATTFFSRVGRMLFRRPLTEVELSETVDLAARAADALGDFYDGAGFGLVSLLISPNFLFVIEDVESAVAESGTTRAVELTAHSKAARLSFFLWNTTPDEEMLDAADRGDLSTREGIDAQIDRLMQSPRLRDGVWAFFTDMLRLEEFAHLEKDNLIYPAFDPVVREDAEQQLLRTITHHLLERDDDYRNLFSTRVALMNGPLGRIYRVPVAEPELWTVHEFSDRTGRSGIQALAGFVAQHSHPGRSSPTIRGKAVRELLLCQSIPDPPGDVDFSLFVSSEKQRTARERLKVHNSVDSCAGCHKLTDVIGLALENFDGAGQFRTRDSGMEIDTSGDLDGASFEDQQAFSQVLSENPAVPECLVQQVFAYGLGRSVRREDKPWLEFLIEQFKDDGYRLRPLIRSIVSSSNFFAVSPLRDDRDEPTGVAYLSAEHQGS